MTDPGFVDLTFPIGGLDQQAAVLGQPAFTTTTGTNVRACDPRTRRLRGGSRSGLSRFIDAIPGGTASVIQHLAVAAYTSNDGLPDDGVMGLAWLNPPPGFDPGEPRPEPPPTSPPPTEYPPTWVDDPLDPNRFLPPDGTGMNRDPDDLTNPPLGPPSGGGSDPGWEYVQSRFIVQPGIIGATPVDGEVTLTGTLDNQLLLVAVYYFSDFTGVGGVDHWEPDVTIAGGGLTWSALTRAQSSQAGSHFDTNLKVFWARNTTAGTITVTVTVTPTGAADAVQKFGLLMVEYKGLLNSTPFEFDATGDDNPAPGPPHTIQPSTPTQQNGQDRLNVMFFSTVEVFAPIADPPTPAAGYTLRVNVNDSEDGSGQVLSQRAYLIDDVNTPSGATVLPSAVCNFNTGDWCAVSGTFRYS